MSINPAPNHRDEYQYFTDITTRWMDNDIYGHVNNVVYYSYFDTVINGFLIENKVLDIHSGEVVGLVVETQCNYFKPVAFPEKIVAGINVDRIGNSSVTYRVGIFSKEDDTALAQGHFVHVYVNKESGRPVPIPQDLRSVLETIKK